MTHSLLRHGIALALMTLSSLPPTVARASAGDVASHWGGFGDRGVVLTPAAGALNQIVGTKVGYGAVGTKNGDFLIQFFEDTGTPYVGTGAGLDGALTIDLGGNDVATATSDTVNYLAGRSDSDLVLAKINGVELDTAFGVNGVLTLDPSLAADDAPAFVRLGANRIWVGRTAVSSCPTAPCPREFRLYAIAPDGKTWSTWSAAFGGDSVLNGLTLLPNEDVVAVGRRCAVGGAACQGVVARFRPTTGLDPTFGTGGYRLAPAVSELSDVVLALADGGQPAGLYAAGSSGGDFSLMRFDLTGALDTTFFGDGLATIDFGGVEGAGRLSHIGPTLWLVGGRTPQGYGVALVDVAASSAARWGQVDLAARGVQDLAVDLLNTNWGTVDVVGVADVQGQSRLMIARHLLTGDLDAGGWWTSRYSADGDGLNWEAVGAGGGPGRPTTLAVIRSAETSLPTLFRGELSDGWSDGISEAPGNNPQFGAIAVQPDGSSTTVGWVNVPGGTDFYVTRWRTDVGTDPDFQGGVVTVDSDARDLAWAVAIQPDGKIVVAGESQGAGSVQASLVRLTADGLVDTSFGSNGRILTNLGGGARVYAVAVDPQGRIVVGGHFIDGSGRYQLMLARFTSAGQPDSTFGVGGVVRDLATAFDADRLALQPDGKIVVAGNSVYDPDAQVLARYTAAGAPDTTFGSGGQILLRTSSYQLRDLALQADRIWVLLSQADGVGPARLLRYTGAGAPDVTFSGDGATELGLTGGADLRSLVVNGGELILTGRVLTPLGVGVAAAAVESGINRVYLPLLRR